jgi:hypothetical protein
MTKQELFTYFEYLNSNKAVLFNSLHKLKNDRELKFSVLLDGEFLNEYLKLTSNIEDVKFRINNEIEKINFESNDLNLLKEKIEEYCRLLDESIAYSEYLKSEVEKIINT